MIVSTKISIERFDSSLYNYQKKNNYIIDDYDRGRTYAFGVYIGHKIYHRVLATGATLLSRPDITMSDGPKDQTSRCPFIRIYCK